MIDGLVGQCGERLTNLWKRDEGGTGKYPPPTLHVSMNLFYYGIYCFPSNLILIDFASVVFLPCVANWFYTFFNPQALLDIYLLENIDEAAKNAIVSFIINAMKFQR